LEVLEETEEPGQAVIHMLALAVVAWVEMVVRLQH
jgi:hypothetical protein